MIASVGFLGAGEMGGGMVRRLLRQSHRVMVWSRDPRKHTALEPLGATLTGDMRHLVRESDVIIGCLRDTDITRTCYLGHDGVITHARPGQTIIEHGTFDPVLADSIAQAAADKGSEFLDAPVTGGPERASSGQLVTMVGGSSAALDRVRSVLSAYCTQITWVGASGSGERLKLVNQLLVSVHIAAAAEASAVVMREGIDPEVALRVLMGGWAASAMLERTMPRACRGEFADSGATVGKLAEVQPLITELLRHADIDSRLLGPVRRLFDESAAEDGANRDLSALVTRYGTFPPLLGDLP